MPTEPPAGPVEPPFEPTYAALAEFAELVGACVEEQGWEVEVDGSGIEVFWGDPANADSANAALAECKERYSDQRPQFAPSPRESYDYQLFVAACLEEQGYSISEPPSFEVYAEEWETGPSWYPYDEVVMGGGVDDAHELNELYEVCPPF